MTKKYENINQADRDSLEVLIAKMVADAYQKGLNHGLIEGNSRAEEGIIKLLEHEIEWGGGVEPMHVKELCVTCKNIAFIKGEN